MSQEVSSGGERAWPEQATAVDAQERAIFRWGSGQCVDVITYPPWLVIQWECHHCGTLKHLNCAKKKNFPLLSYTKFFCYPSRLFFFFSSGFSA